ncbi:hypothetical protein EV175_000682 [Coemansia sp. RSA 1933]|nr:hypothetical protein EV175_000682 [Coemansia sp. RSA 1933]
MGVNHNIRYLKSLEAVRERAHEVLRRAEQGQLRHFEYDASKVDSVAEAVYALIERDYGSVSKVPMHGRWRSYCVGGRDLVSEHVTRWRGADVSEWECARRIIDLFMVSVLIDAGAGSAWTFRDTEFGAMQRTEGLGLAALRMFESGVFSSAENPFQVDAVALEALDDQALEQGFQVSAENPLPGCKNRAQLLRSLGRALRTEPQYFGGICACNKHPARPGFMLDYLTGCAESARAVSIDDVWTVVVDGLASVWPASRTKLDGVALGDVWQCDTLAVDQQGGEPVPGVHSLVPFHKLSQWLTWSLLEVITQLARFTVSGTERLTGLPEYRNGGLLVDMGVLTLTPAARARSPQAIPQFDTADPVIVEWRAMTVALLDVVAQRVKKLSGLDDNQVPPMFLSRVLEGGTWKAGREIAVALRGESRDPPINIISDGTVF